MVVQYDEDVIVNSPYTLKAKNILRIGPTDTQCINLQDIPDPEHPNKPLLDIDQCIVAHQEIYARNILRIGPNDIQCINLQDIPSGDSPLLYIDRGVIVKKDIAAIGGALFTAGDPNMYNGCGGGAVMMGHAYTATTDPPMIVLSESTSGYNTLWIKQGDGDPNNRYAVNWLWGHLVLGNMLAHGTLTVEGNTTMGNASFQNGCSVAPVNDNQSFVGNMTKMWNSVCTRNLQMGVVGTGNVTFSIDNSSGLILYFDTSSTTGGIVPLYSGKTFALGTSSNRWHDVYATNTMTYNLSSGVIGQAISVNSKLNATGGLAIPTSAPSSLQNGDIWLA